jgi:hypothetical protein
MFMSGPDRERAVKMVGDAEETLRLLTQIAVPEGLEDRVQARLSAEPRRARILAWPAKAWVGNGGWMRTAAAAAIVFVVAGGGWSVYSRVQPGAPANAVVASPHVGTGGSFAEGGAVRRPQTLQGPVVKNAVPKAKTPAKGSSVAASTLTPGEKKATAAVVAPPVQ